MRTNLKAGTLLAPLPAVMVTSGTPEQANVLTVAWTGIIKFYFQAQCIFSLDNRGKIVYNLLNTRRKI